jgi:hypothetical protein
MTVERVGMSMGKVVPAVIARAEFDLICRAVQGTPGLRRRLRIALKSGFIQEWGDVWGIMEHQRKQEVRA